MHDKILEIKKPSELCQVLYYSDFTKKEQANITPLQIDLIEVIFFNVAETLELEKLDAEQIDEWSSLNHFEFDLQTIAKTLGRYENGFYDPIVSNLQELSQIQVLTNTLHKNKSRESVLYHFIRKMAWEQDSSNGKRSIKIWLEPELLGMFLNIKNYYTTFALQIRFGLKSKYSKLLYSILKDYNGVNSKTIDFSILPRLLNVDVIDRPNLSTWSHFNRDLLKKTVKEINDKSDIFITYTPIKERDENNKLKVDRIKFDIKSQKSILLDYTINNKADDPTEIYEMSRAELKLDDMATKKMEEAIVFGTKVKCKKSYKATVIKNLIQEGIDIDSIIEMADILEEIKANFISLKNNMNQLIVVENYQGQAIVSISNDYLLFSPVDKINVSKTVKETISMINNLNNNGKSFKLIETPTKVSELEISYL